MFQSLSPVIYVETIEPCIPFWTERLGFSLVAEVPHEGSLGFAMLERDGVTVMYQSFASAEDDVPGLVEAGLPPTTGLFFVVTDFDALLESLDGAEIVLEERQTAYAAREIAVRAPCGSVVAFAVDVEG